MKTINTRNKPASRPKTTAAKPEQAPEFIQINSTDLFKGSRELRIQHQDREYRLRITRLNKLIMTV